MSKEKNTNPVSDESPEEKVTKEKEKGKTLRLVLIIGLVLVVISSPLWLCGGCAVIGSLLPDSGTTEIEDETEDLLEDGEEALEEDEEEVKEYKIGDKVELGDYVIEVTALEDIAATDMWTPDEGNKFVAVEVVYENISNKPVSYNVYDWTLFDSDSYSYQPTISIKEPTLNSGDLNSGKKVRGWITFEVPDDSSKYSVQFNPNWLSNENVEIVLY
jgi:hypothetical protein